MRDDERGQATMFLCMVMGLIFLGFIGLTVDVGLMFREQRMAQAAADSAATAAAEEAPYGSATSAALAMAQIQGFGASTVTVNNPPLHGAYAGNDLYTEVIIAEPMPTYFMRWFHPSAVTISARAVGGGGLASPTCICLEGTSGQDLSMSNGATLSAPTCGLIEDSSASNAITIYGGATAEPLTMGTVSNSWDDSGNVYGGGSVSSSTEVVQGLTSSCAPTMPAAPTAAQYGSCGADPLGSHGNGGSSYTVGPASSTSYICYTSLDIGSNGDAVTLNPGYYVINGGELHFQNGANNHSNLGGNGVFFYLFGSASLVIDSGANVSLSAPTSGTYSGILIYQNASDTSAISIQGGSMSAFSGAILAPGAAITLGNGSGSSFSADIVAQTLTLNGGGTLTSTATTNMGTLNLTVAKVAE